MYRIPVLVAAAAVTASNLITLIPKSDPTVIGLIKAESIVEQEWIEGVDGRKAMIAR